MARRQAAKVLMLYMIAPSRPLGHELIDPTLWRQILQGVM